MNSINRFNTVEKHIREFFADHPITEHQWTLGPVPEAMPEFRVLCAAPGNRTGCWTYLSVGASCIEHEDSGLLEFFIISPVEDLRNVELVTMTAWYHKSKTLGWGHTFPIGESWLGDSHCDHMLISTPYPFGPDLEICNFPNGHIHLLWLLPITEAERDYKLANDLESLEQSFEDAGLEYWNVSRSSVV
ncbi:suppressor of fused domain protein [Stieleria sp. JC731]|uniref:suppressor of fused domain protein n=1 Tax=Pirellulaceae TaxID=2691357 RepID=UPI001E607EC3|nr:suppressor of fused domain protein [Stieleria sp. JC731]MCC9602248.1 suppressor of fused domain protein [Stieleria sp. JC731]